MTPKVIEASRKKGYTIFEQDDKPFNLNLIAVRSDNAIPNIFNDWFYICWKFKGKWSEFSFPVTCDAGLYWLNNPMNKLGTAIVKEGQYKGLWKTGLHKSRYFALVQKNPITIIRDYNKNNVLDYNSGVTEKGLFGINHHRANPNWESKKIEKWSAGCIVNPNPKIFEIEMEIFREAAAIWGNSFTFTLLKQSDL